MKEKVQNILAYLGHDLIERDEPLKLALLSILAGENSVLLGPPGTGKSLMARRIADMIEHPDGKGGYFEYLLTKFSTPDEIFGPLSIAELKSDRFRRNTEKYLPTASIGFLDEIFKSNSSILNSLLTILNERIYHNGAEAQKVPLRALIAASNEVPNEHDELTALYDRFLLRCFVDYVSDAGFEGLFDEPQPQERPASITENEMDSILNGSGKVALPEEVISAISQIWRAHKDAFKEDRRESLSDRRLKKAVKLIKVSAHTNGRNEADLSDVLLLKNCLWNHPENAAKVQDIVLNVLKEFSHPIEFDNKSIQETSEFGNASYNPSKVPEKGKTHTVVKGFSGQGTADDPILIQTAEDFVDLARTEVGMRGYYFRQASNIDCSAIEHWPKINFTGHYDGAQHEIKANTRSLFNAIVDKSSIFGLKITDVSLAEEIIDSDVSFCTCNTDLIRSSASRSTFLMIEVQRSLIYTPDQIYRIMASISMKSINLDSTLSECTVERCKTGAIAAAVSKDSKFIDCDFTNKGPHLGQPTQSGIVDLFKGSSLIQRCIVSGNINYSDKSGGLVHESQGGEIRDSVLGQTSDSPRYGIIFENSGNSTKLFNNASAGMHGYQSGGYDDPDGCNGRSVDPKLFNQRFFEFTLNWDFENTWYWDDKENRPELRSIGFDGIDTPSAVSDGEQGGIKIDLLTKQVKENIWL